MTTTAIAHPIQGLVKYHGLRDTARRLPLHDSISVCVAPLHTRTTVTATDDEPRDRIVIDGEEAAGRALERCITVLDAVRKAGDTETRFVVDSENDFPQKVGLGSSSSGFAALALAAVRELDLDLDLTEISGLARLGAGSASRAVTGWTSLWETDSGLSRCLPGAEELTWPILMPLVEHEEPTEGVHQDVLASPFLPCRIRSVPARIAQATAAVANGDLGELHGLAERDTLDLHAITMTGAKGRITWQPATVALMRTVWELRDDGVPVHFSIDTGATPYLNVAPGHEARVRSAVERIEGVARVLEGEPGPEAHLVKGT